MTLCDFKAKDIAGNEVDLSVYKGQVLLVVNTAVKCNLTPQYTALQRIYKQFHKRGFEVLDFPCDQFGSQAPGTDEKINEFCRMQYRTTFPRFGKILVNGSYAHPLYQWLKKEVPEDEMDIQAQFFVEKIQKFIQDKKEGDIIWNFCKFLVNQEGKVIARYSPAYSMETIEKDIERILGESY